MAKRHTSPIVGVGPFERKKDAGVPEKFPQQSGTVNPTDAKSSKVGAKLIRDSRHNQRKQRAK